MYNCIIRTKVITDPQDVIELIEGIETYGLRVVPLGNGCKYKSLQAFKADNKWLGFCDNIAINLKDTRLEITSRYGKYYLDKVCTYIFDLNEDPIFGVSGLKTFAEFSKALKMPKGCEYGDLLENYYDKETGKYVCSAKPILGHKKESDNLENVYEYDLNSAYSNVILNGIPDLKQPELNKKVTENHVGFLIDDDLTMVPEGYDADVVFPIVPCPEALKNYIHKWKNIKDAAKIREDDIEALTAKAYLNLPVGYTQRYNPFFRSYVVNSCNNYIRSIMDKNTFMWNTDAIFSTVERPDLPVADEIGKFKVIKCDKFKYIGANYQINDEIPTYRGISKHWFEAFEKINGRRFDILKDRVPEHINKWYWDWATLTLKESDFDN